MSKSIPIYYNKCSFSCFIYHSFHRQITWLITKPQFNLVINFIWVIHKQHHAKRGEFYSRYCDDMWHREELGKQKYSKWRLCALHSTKWSTASSMKVELSKKSFSTSFSASAVLTADIHQRTILFCQHINKHLHQLKMLWHLWSSTLK